MPKVTEIGALKIAKPDEWRRRLRAAIRQAKGDLAGAADALGVARRTLSRWIECEERRGEARSAKQDVRCGTCAGCQVLGDKLIKTLNAPGRPWPEDDE